MGESLDDYLEERENEIKTEKQRQLDIVAKMREERENTQQKFVDCAVKTIKPTLLKLNKKFNAKGHTLQINRENLDDIPNIEYALNMNEGGTTTFIIDFESNISNVEVAFRMFKHGSPTKSFDKNFTFEVSEVEIEQEIISGLRFLTNK